MSNLQQSLKLETEGPQLLKTACHKAGILEKKILCTNCPKHCRIFSIPETHPLSTNGLKSCDTKISHHTFLNTSYWQHHIH